MELTRQQALDLHRQMWTDMQKELGDTGKGRAVSLITARNDFKEKWVKEHLHSEHILENCVLCEYANRERLKRGCKINRCEYCPINWGYYIRFGCECNEIIWSRSPISEILALPEREDV